MQTLLNMKITLCTHQTSLQYRRNFNERALTIFFKQKPCTLCMILMAAEG